MIEQIKAKLRPIKHDLVTKRDYYKWKIKNWINYRMDSFISNQLKNPLSIPIIIISFNQLFYLRQLVDFLLNRGFTNVVIIDNNSSYPPLLEYFDTMEKNPNITIHRLNDNIGHLVFWKKNELFKKYSKGFYVVTDADVVPSEDTPTDFMHYFMKLLNNIKEITKVGFSLHLDDIPATNPNRDNIRNWEEQFWKQKIGTDFLASVDTTFALYRPHYNREEHNFLHAIRTNSPYFARHGGWYLNPNALTDEQKYYIRTANSSSSWLTDEKGELINEEFKSHYKKKQ